MFKPTKYKCLFENCHREVIKFRSTDKCYCAEHRYVVLKQNKKKIVKIKQISDKRAVQLKEYSKLRKEFLKEHPMCAVYPYLKSNQVHHIRGRVGSLLNDVRYFLAVSPEGHTQIEMNPDWARSKGFIEKRLKDE